MADRSVVIDASKPIDVNLVVNSPHVVAYRIWTQAPNATTWQLIHEGKTDDDVPDHKAFSATKATKLAYWLGIGGNTGTNFRVIISLAQDGKILANGTFVEEGLTDGSGIAVVQRQDVVFA